jgi:hypothetical protein
VTRAEAIERWAANWRTLRAWRRDLSEVKVSVSNKIHSNRLGTCWPREQRIVIYQGESFIDELGTLLHELAHAATIDQRHGERWQETFAAAVTEVTSIVVGPLAYNYRVLNIAAKDALKAWWWHSGNADRWELAKQLSRA